MLKTTQRELLHLHQVASRTFGRQGAGKARVTFQGSQDGLTVRMDHDEIMVTCRSREPQPDCESFSVEADRLRPFRRACDEPVVFRIGEHATSCSVTSGSMHVSAVPAEPAEPLEETTPVRSASFDRNVLQHLADCSTMTDRDSARFALQCLQLDGEKSAVAATDGRKALRVTGIEWPWDDVRLVPACGWFAAPVVRSRHEELMVADLDGHVRFSIGPWSIELPVREGRFPDVARVFPARWQADTVIRLTDEDGQAIHRALQSLPKGPRSTPDAVTLELGRPCVLRTTHQSNEKEDSNDERPASVNEVALPGVTYSGLPFRAALPRHALTDFVRLGFRELMATEAAKTFWCREPNRQFAFMPLHPDFAVPAADTRTPSADRFGSVA